MEQEEAGELLGVQGEKRLAGQHESAAAGTEAAQPACRPGGGDSVRCHHDPISVERRLPSKIRINLEDNVQYVSMRKSVRDLVLMYHWVI